MPIVAASRSVSMGIAREPGCPRANDRLMDASGTDAYAAIAVLYDLEHASFEADLDLYRNVAEAVGDPILELGCGSGRVLVPLAGCGFRVTGLDRSPPMLALARDRAQGAGVSPWVTLATGTMTDAASVAGGPFGLVLIPLDGILHLDRPEEQRAALAAARAALDPRGQLVLDVLNPSPETLRGFDGTVVAEGAWTLPDGTRVDKFSSRRHNQAEQLIETQLWYDLLSPDGSLRRVRTAFSMRYLHRAELELLLEVTGYAQWELYGSYELEPLEDGSDRLIVLAEATAS